MRSVRPKVLAQLFTADDFAGMFQKQRQNAEGLVRKFDAGAAAREQSARQVHFKLIKAAHAVLARQKHGHNLAETRASISRYQHKDLNRTKPRNSTILRQVRSWSERFPLTLSAFPSIRAMS